jgi:hypothetical protein
LFRRGRLPICLEVAIPTSPVPGNAWILKFSPFVRLPAL